jgi:hypothetical protein
VSRPEDFDIAAWLESLGFGQYAESFAANKITREDLAEMSHADLQSCGVVALADRKKLLRAIAELETTPEGPPEVGSGTGEEERIAEPAALIPAPKVPSLPPAIAPPKPRGPAASRSAATVPPDSAEVAPAPASPIPPAPVASSSPARRRGFWAALIASKFLFISIIAHLLFGAGATVFIVQRIQAKRKVSFQSGPPSASPKKRALEHKVSMAQKKKTGGAPPQAKRIVSTGIAKVSMPEMPSMPSASNVVPGMMAGMGGAGFGAGMGFGSGMGSGMGGGVGGGGGINFFGLRTSAKRIAFLLDYSGSMSGPFRKTMERELENALSKLPPGTQILLIPWAGPAWLHNQTAPQIMDKWKKIDDYDNFALRDGAKLDPPAWVSGGPTNVEEIMKGIRAQVAAPGGTDWRQPFRYAMQATPPPDVLIFMTDGQIPPKTADRALSAIDAALRKTSRAPVVTCLWIENTKQHGDELKAIAKKYKGEFRVVTAAGAKD